MRVAYLTHAFPPGVGGVQSFAKAIADGLAARGDTVRVLAPGADRLPQEDRLPYRVVRAPGIRDWIEHVRWADVVLENSAFLKLVPVHLACRTPRVQVIHDRQALAALREADPVKRWIGLRINDFRLGWSRRADRLVAVSHDVSTETGSVAQVIHNGYDAATFHDDVPFEQRPARSMITVGRLVRDKGIDLLLTAMTELRREGVDSSLTVVGDGPEAGNLRRQAAGSGLGDRVLFIGRKSPDEVNAALNAARVFVMPSRVREGFGLSVVEAQAAGCAVVGSDNGGVSEAMNTYGYLYRPGEPQALRETLRSVLLDEQLQVAGRVPAEVMGGRNQEVMVDRYARLLEDVASCRRPARAFG